MEEITLKGHAKLSGQIIFNRAKDIC